VESHIGDNLVQYLPGTTEEAACWAACQSTETCAFYTHYNDTDPSFPASCFLLSGLQPVKPCDHCMTGASDCSCDGAACKGDNLEAGLCNQQECGGELNVMSVPELPAGKAKSYVLSCLQCGKEGFSKGGN
jgi:hypothetical protein